VDIDLDKGRFSNASKTVDLSSLDDQDIPRARLEFLSIHHVSAASLPDELDFIIRMAMGTWAPSWKGAEQEDGDVDIAVLGANELMRAAHERQVLLMNAIHRRRTPAGVAWCRSEMALKVPVVEHRR
jgi:hypothetical protein